MTPYPGMQPGPMMNQQNAQQSGMQPISGHPMMHPALPGVMGAIHQAMPTSQPMHPAMVGALNDFLHAHSQMQPAPQTNSFGGNPMLSGPGMLSSYGQQQVRNAGNTMLNQSPNMQSGPMMGPAPGWGSPRAQMGGMSPGAMSTLNGRVGGPGYR